MFYTTNVSYKCGTPDNINTDLDSLISSTFLNFNCFDYNAYFGPINKKCKDIYRIHGYSFDDEDDLVECIKTIVDIPEINILFILSFDDNSYPFNEIVYCSKLTYKNLDPNLKKKYRKSCKQVAGLRKKIFDVLSISK